MREPRSRCAVVPAPTAWAGLAILVMLASLPLGVGDSPAGAGEDLPTVTSAEQGNPTPAAGLTDEPAIEVWFAEGCDATYPIGAWLHMRYRANVAGLARVWRYPDRELFVQDWMEPGQTHEILGPVTGPPGRWWIFGELLESGATASCHYTTTEALTATATLPPTAGPPTPPHVTASPEPTQAPSPSRSPGPSAGPQATNTPAPARTHEPSETATTTGTGQPTESPGLTEPAIPTPEPEATSAPTEVPSPTNAVPSPAASAPPGTPLGTATAIGTAAPGFLPLWLPALFRPIGAPPHPIGPTLRR